MRAKIRYSRFALVLTAIIFVLFFVGCIATVNEEPAFFFLLGIYFLLFLCTLFFAPAYIEVNDRNIVLGCILRNKKIPLKDVESVEVFQPTMGTIRLCTSGGFMVY